MAEGPEEVVAPDVPDRVEGEASEQEQRYSASFQASWERLSPQAQYALCCLSLFTQSFTDIDARMAFPPVTPENMRALREAALMQFVPTDPRPYSLPSEIRAYAQAKRASLDATTRSEIEKRFIGRYCTLMEQHFPGITNCHPPTMGLVAAMYADTVAAFQLAIERNDEEHASTLYFALDHYQEHRAFWSENLSLEETMLAFRRRMLPPGHHDIAASLNNLGNWYRDQERYAEAEPLYQEALAIDRAAGPERRSGIAAILNNLALGYDSQRRYAEAEVAYKEALAIQRSILPSGHPDIAKTLNNLGELYRVQRLFSQARPLFQESLAIRRHSLPEGHPDIAQSLNNISLWYCDQGNYSAAEVYLREALHILRTALGDEHPITQSIVGNYAGLQHQIQQSGSGGWRAWWQRLFGG